MVPSRLRTPVLIELRDSIEPAVIFPEATTVSDDTSDATATVVAAIVGTDRDPLTVTVDSCAIPLMVILGAETPRFVTNLLGLGDTERVPVTPPPVRVITPLVSTVEVPTLRVVGAVTDPSDCTDIPPDEGVLLCRILTAVEESAVVGMVRYSEASRVFHAEPEGVAVRTAARGLAPTVIGVSGSFPGLSEALSEMKASAPMELLPDVASASVRYRTITLSAKKSMSSARQLLTEFWYVIVPYC